MTTMSKQPERKRLVVSPKAQYLMRWWGVKYQLEAEIVPHRPVGNEKPSAEYTRLRTLIDQANTALIEGKEPELIEE